MKTVAEVDALAAAAHAGQVDKIALPYSDHPGYEEALNGG